MYTTGLTIDRPEDSLQGSTNPGETAPQAASALSVVIERSPSALARVYSVLCLMNLVPESFGGAQLGDDAVRVDFVFGSVPDRRLDLLTRKLAQLTECLQVTVLPLRERATP